MKLKNKVALLLFALLSIFGSCKKYKNTTDPADQLPPATQRGANTFGCFVNGKVYVPKGFNGNGRPNPHIQYDINLNGRPYLGITADQIIDANYRGSILVSYRNLDHQGTFIMPDDFNFSAGWIDVIGTCGTIAFDTTIKKWGGG